MTHLLGNHTITKENAHKYAGVTSIGGDATIRAACPALTSIGGDATIRAACPALTSIGGNAYIYADCPVLTSIGGYAYIYAACPVLTTIGGYADIRAACPALTSIGGDAYIYADCPVLTSIGGDADINAACPVLTSIGGKPVSPLADQIAYRAKVAKAILAKPQDFNMEKWHCGTQHCLAGWAQHLAGPEWSEKAGVYPSTAGACLLGPSVAPLFYRIGETAEVLAEIATWITPEEDAR
jgi:hypothetical protein